MLIAVIYWTVGFTGYQGRGRVYIVDDLSLHALPITLLGVDFIVNAVKFPAKHVTIVKVFISGYLMFNFGASEIRGDPIYA